MALKARVAGGIGPDAPPIRCKIANVPSPLYDQRRGPQGVAKLLAEDPDFEGCKAVAVIVPRGDRRGQTPFRVLLTAIEAPDGEVVGYLHMASTAQKMRLFGTEPGGLNQYKTTDYEPTFAGSYERRLKESVGAFWKELEERLKKIDPGFQVEVSDVHFGRTARVGIGAKYRWAVDLTSWGNDGFYELTTGMLEKKLRFCPIEPPWDRIVAPMATFIHGRIAERQAQARALALRSTGEQDFWPTMEQHLKDTYPDLRVSLDAKGRRADLYSQGGHVCVSIQKWGSDASTYELRGEVSKNVRFTITDPPWERLAATILPVFNARVELAKETRAEMERKAAEDEARRVKALAQGDLAVPDLSAEDDDTIVLDAAGRGHRSLEGKHIDQALQWMLRFGTRNRQLANPKLQIEAGSPGGIYLLDGDHPSFAEGKSAADMPEAVVLHSPITQPFLVGPRR